MKSSDINSLHSAACQLWKAGFSVVPLYPKQKRPALDKWTPYQEKRCTINEINQWWSTSSKQLFGIGIVTGTVSHNITLDFDPAQGSTAEQLLKEAEAHFGKKFPETCRVRTASLGWHDHYTTNERVNSCLFFAGKHGRIELRAEGSIAVMPPTEVIPKHAKPGVTGQYIYLRGIDQRVAWEGTWMSSVIKNRENSNRNPSALGDRPTNIEIQATLTALKPLLTKIAQAILDGSIVPDDRSRQSYWLACEIIRSGQRSPRTIATLILAAPYHEEKYDPRKSGWDDWKDACSCALRALSDTGFSTSADGSSNIPSNIIKINMADVPTEDSRFLIRPYIPRGEITLLDGNPGEGKTWVWMALVAGLTGSKVCPVPYDYGAPKNAKVVIMTTEDDPTRTLAKRFDELGANKNNIILLGKPAQIKNEPVDYRQINPVTAADLEAVTPVIIAEKPDLIVIDPIVLYATTDKDFDGDKAVRVRGMLSNLKSLAVQLDCAVLVVRHFRKQAAVKAIYRGSGSIDYVATARSVLIVAIDKKTGQKAMSHAKCNLDATGPTIFFTLNNNDYPAFKWTEISEDTKADSLTDDTRSSAEEEREERKEHERLLVEEAEAFLLEILSDGPVPAKQIVKEAASIKLSEPTLYKAKSKLGILSKRHGFGKDASYSWMLPKHVKGGNSH